MTLAIGVPFEVCRSIDEIEATDIVIVPSVVLQPKGWEKGRYPRLLRAGEQPKPPGGGCLRTAARQPNAARRGRLSR